MNKEILNKIKEYDVITIFRHIRPDGDAYGAQMGLKQIIKDNFPDKKVYALGEPNAHWGNIMGEVDSKVTNARIADSLAIVLDTPIISRVDDERFQDAKEIIKIDHHPFVEKFAEIELIDSERISTCELICEFANENKLEISPYAAAYLYTGLVLDSGRFMFANTNSKTFDDASLLLSKGVDITSIYDYIYETKEEEVRLRGYCELNYKKTPNGVAYMIIDDELKKEFNISEFQSSGLVNCLSHIKGIKIWVFFVSKDNKVKVELRSAGLPINEVAKKYNGGGHKLASGAIIDSFDQVDAIVKDLDDLAKGEQL